MRNMNLIKLSLSMQLISNRINKFQLQFTSIKINKLKKRFIKQKKLIVESLSGTLKVLETSIFSPQTAMFLFQVSLEISQMRIQQLLAKLRDSMSCLQQLSLSVLRMIREESIDFILSTIMIIQEQTKRILRFMLALKTQRAMLQQWIKQAAPYT